MAEVRLGRYEAEDGRLPFVCMCCGEPADMYKSKQLSWYPPWVNALAIAPLPFVIVALIITKRLRARVPLCPAHTYHWTWRTVAVLTSLVVVIALGIAAAVLVERLDRQQRNAGGFVCIGALVLGVVWLVAVVVIQATAIRPKEITDRDITLTHVSEKFVEAVRAARRRRRGDRDEDDFDDRPRRRRRPRYEDEEEDEYYDR